MPPSDVLTGGKDSSPTPHKLNLRNGRVSNLKEGVAYSFRDTSALFGVESEAGDDPVCEGRESFRKAFAKLDLFHGDSSIGACLRCPHEPIPFLRV